MSVRNIVYLFDVEKYKTTIKPILPHLEAGDDELLRITATHLARENPEIWSILRNYRYFPDDLGNEDQEFDMVEARIHFWMTIILSNFWKPLKVPRNFILLVDKMFSLVNINGEMPDDAIFEKPIWKLFLPDPNKDNLLSEQSPEWFNLGFIRWLDYKDVANLRRFLISKRNCFKWDYQDVKNFRKILLSEKHFSIDEDQQEGSRTYQLVMEILLEAYRHQKGLCFDIVD